MTKADLVAIMAKSAGGSKTAAEKAMNAFVSGIYESLRRGRRVTISGFGTFSSGFGLALSSSLPTVSFFSQPTSAAKKIATAKPEMIDGFIYCFFSKLNS